MRDQIEAALITAYSRLVVRTARVTIKVSNPADRCVWICWHEYAFACVLGIVGAADFPLPCLVGLKDRRGDVLERSYRKFGGEMIHLAYYHAVESTGVKAADVVDYVRKCGSCLITPDGPGGPYRVMKPGAFEIARDAHVDVRALHVRVSRKLRLWRWDRFVLPMPFARIEIAATNSLPE